MMLEGHTVTYRNEDYQVCYSPKGRYYYIWRHSMSGEKFAVEIEYNKSEKEND